MKLTMMCGLPGSGKTTRARKLVVESGNSARVNRDDLRAMLFDGKWSGKREAAVIAVEKAVAAALLKHGLNPVIDDTNLLPKHEQMWRQFAVDQGQGKTLSFQIEDIDTLREHCIGADFFYRKGTKAFVGAPVINRMAAQSGRIEWGEAPILIVDLDGTICDGRHREHLVQPGTKDWKEYFARCGQDLPIQFVIDMVNAMADTHKVVIVSGRPDSTWMDTREWLIRYGVKFDLVFMRASSDPRSDVLVKTDILNLLPKHLIAFCFDDRPCVVNQVWRENGIRVIPVRGACEPF